VRLVSCHSRARMQMWPNSGVGKPELAGVALSKKQQSGSKRMAEVKSNLNQISECDGQEHSSSYIVTILAVLSSKTLVLGRRTNSPLWAVGYAEPSGSPVRTRSPQKAPEGRDFSRNRLCGVALPYLK
jgi:hypothetical protein